MSNQITSVYTSRTGAIPTDPGNAFWKELPVQGDFVVCGTGEKAGADVETTFSVAHDTECLYVAVTCREPEPELIRTSRRGKDGFLSLDDCIEILLDPRQKGEGEGVWRIVVTPAGELQTVLPPGDSFLLGCEVFVERADTEWSAIVSLPFAELAPDGTLAGTPTDGELWGINVARLRHEIPPFYKRQRLCWNLPSPEADPADTSALGVLSFSGGRKETPVSLDKYTSPHYGANLIAIVFAGGAVPEGTEVTIKPEPARKLRSKGMMRQKFRIARAGDYIMTVCIPGVEPEEEEEETEEAPPDEADTDHETEELEDSGESTPPYVAGLSFRIKQIWDVVEATEDEIEKLQALCSEKGIEIEQDLQMELSVLEGTLIRLDRYRSPHCRDRMPDNLPGLLRKQFVSCRGKLRRKLMDIGVVHVVSPYAREGNWVKGCVDVVTGHSGLGEKAEVLVETLKSSGFGFACVCDPPRGGEQDGDGTHDWDRDGTVSAEARTFTNEAGETGVVPFDTGREAFVRDYSKSAAEQGIEWVEENWKLSVPEQFVVVTGARVGGHTTVCCYGLPPGRFDWRENEYRAIDACREDGGLAVVSLPEPPPSGTPGLHPLPPELEGVSAIENDVVLWDSLLSDGKKTWLMQAKELSRLEESEGAEKLPARQPWMAVRVSELTEASVKEALRSGNFYTSTGPVIEDIVVEGDTITVKTASDCHMVFIGEGGGILAGGTGKEASYKFTGAESYVRIVCLEDVEEDGFKREALTQPFYLSDPPYTPPAILEEEELPAAEAESASETPEDLRSPEQ